MNKVELTLYEAREEFGQMLCESSQEMEIRFAYVNSKYEQVTRNFRCKDYMNVPPFVMKNPSHSGNRVYGLSYSSVKHPIDMDVTRISIWFKDKNNVPNFIKNMAELNKIEEYYKIPLTKLLTTQHDDIVVIEGDKAWQSNCWKMSMYTMYLRRMGWMNFSKPGGTDYSYARNLNNNKGIEDAFLSLINTEFTEDFRGVGGAHSSSGINTIMHYYSCSLNIGDSAIPYEYQNIIKALGSIIKLKKAA